MSHQTDKLWTEEEKNFLLTEILKKAGVSSGYLFSIIRENHVTPNWMEIPLPSGRSLNSCQTAFYRMEHEFSHHQYRQSLPGPTNPLQMSPTSRKRPLSSTFSDKGPPRAIQPKPPLSSERFAAPDTQTPVPIPRVTETFRGETPRKRGRPSKADIQRRNMMNQARMQQIPQPRNPIPRAIIGSEPTPPTTALQPSLFAVAGDQQPASPERTRDSEHERRMSMQFQGTDAPTSQTQDIQVRRPSRPQSQIESGLFGDSSTTIEPKESTPRTMLESHVSPSPTSLGPPPPVGSGSQRAEGSYLSTGTGTGPPPSTGQSQPATGVTAPETREKKEP